MEYQIKLGAYIYQGEPCTCYTKDISSYHQTVDIKKGDILYGVDNGEYMELWMVDGIDMRGQHILMSELKPWQNNEGTVQALIDAGYNKRAMRDYMLALMTFFKNKNSKKDFLPVLEADCFHDDDLNDLSESLWTMVEDHFKDLKQRYGFQRKDTGKDKA